MAAPGSLPFAVDASSAVKKDGTPKPELSPLLSEIKGKLTLARNSRTAKEGEWREALRQFRGLDNETFRQSEHSKVSLGTTRVKTKAAVAQIVEAMFTNGKFPISIKATEVPEGTYEFAHIADVMEGEEQPPEQPPQSPQTPMSRFGFEGDGRKMDLQSLLDPMGPAFWNLPPEIAETKEVKEGVGMNGEPTISPAKEAAVKMEKSIKDQLTACKADAQVQKAIFECCILGTGVMKGPFNTTIELPRWERDENGARVYRPKQVTKPEVSFVSVWDLYIDPACETIMDAEWVIERHKMNFVELRKLKRHPLFNSSAIDAVLLAGPNYEDSMSTDTTTEDPKVNAALARSSSLFEVFEYWGYLPTDKLAEYGIRTPDDSSDFVQVNVWFSGDHVIRVNLNPFEPSRIPYYVFPYETDPYSIYGVGVPYIMADQQKLINGFLRMAVDNLALAGNMVFDVDESALAPGQPMEIAPGQIFRRIAGSPGQAVYGIKFPSTANENLMMVREVRAHADEATGIPSIAHGQSGVTGYGRTSSGMSMLLNNASLNIKSVVRNIDNSLIVPLAQAMFAWNMQFNGEEHPDIIGDLEIEATGASGLEMKDVEVQRLQTFLQLSMNPAIAPLIKFPTIIKRLAQVMDTDPEDVLNTPEEAMAYAQLMGTQGMQQTGAGGVPGLAPEAPMPGQQGFTGNDVGAGNQFGMNGAVPGVNAPQGAM
ncbi:head-tail adaptor [Aeromonas phage 1233]|nr:head-tail adaptor [Aeromonas phage 1233]